MPDDTARGVTIRLRRDGPYVVEGGEVRIVDWNGTEHRATKMPVALCRCGQSSSKPFCDGSHAGRSGQKHPERERSTAPDSKS